jgi:hypothetical protein
MPRLAGALLLMVFATALVGAPSETFTIKVKEFPDKGKPRKVIEKRTQVTKVKVTDEDGNSTNQPDQLKSEEVIYTQKVLEVGDKGPTKIQRKYDKAILTEGKQTKTEPHQGRTIVYQFVDGKVKASAEGKPALAAKALAELADEALKDFEPRKQHLLPKKAVKVGENWSLSGKDLLAMFQTPGVAPEKCKGSGKLVKVYQKAGKQWGTLEFRFQIPVPTRDGPLQTENTLTVDTPIDGSSTDVLLKAKTQVVPVKKVVEDMGKKYKVEATSELTGTREQTEEK